MLIQQPACKNMGFVQYEWMMMKNLTIPDYNISEDYISKKSPSTGRILEELKFLIISKINLDLSKEGPIWKCYFVFIHINTKGAAKASWLKSNIFRHLAKISPNDKYALIMHIYHVNRFG